MKKPWYSPVKPMALVAQCQRNGCADPALRVPKLLIPVKGHPTADPFEILIDIQLCRACMRALPVADFLTKLVRGAAKHILRQAGCEPDFAAAYFRSLHIMSAEYRQFQRVGLGDASRSDSVMMDGMLQ